MPHRHVARACQRMQPTARMKGSRPADGPVPGVGSLLHTQQPSPCSLSPPFLSSLALSACPDPLSLQNERCCNRIADLEQQIGATKSALVRADLERKLAKEMVLVEEAEAKMRVGGNMPHSGSRSELDRARSGSGSLPRSSSRSELERARSGGGDRSRSSHREREQRSSSRHRDYEREHRSSSRSRYEAHGMSRTSSRDEMHRSSSRNDMQRTSSRDEMHRSSSRNDMQRTGSSGSLSKSQRTQQAERANSAASGSGSGGSGNAGLANGHPVTMKKFLQDI